MNKVVLITGASSGIGKITAEYLAEQGYTVYGTSRKVQSERFRFQMLQMDVLKKRSIDQVIETIKQREGRLDILVNNAGMGITGPIEETATEEVKKVFDTNLFGAVEVINATLPLMREQKSGLIINVTSIAGYMGLPFRGFYSATKGALETVSEALSMEVKSFGIKVCCVAPGDFATNIAKGRYHSPVLEHSAYKNVYQKNLDLMNSHVSEGSDPKKMAEAILKIMNNPTPKIHYKVGEPLQKFSIFLKRILPDRIFEKILMKHYKMY